MKNPIIFVHYGNSEYLKYTFKAVRLFNPKKRIILLGDGSNLRVAKLNGVEHFNFQDFSDSVELNEFNKIYRHVAGAKHGKEFWTNFVFKRWFFVHSFLKTHQIFKGFWHFDSDNLILTDLAKQEFKFQKYDCTEQCNGMCMNGYISSFEVVDLYVKKINELFQNNVYIEKQQEEFKKQPEYAFTEMRAYKAFKEQNNIKSVRLNMVIENQTFDDCICQSHNMEIYSEKLGNRVLKKLYVSSKTNYIYCYNNKAGSFTKMNSLNMSWVPDYLCHILYSIAKKSLNKTDPGIPSKDELQEINIFQVPFSYKLNNLVFRLMNKIS